MKRMVVQSTQSRKLVGQLERGEDLIQGLMAIGQEHHVRSGSVRIWGVVEELRLLQRAPSGAAAGANTTRQIAGSAQVLQGSGMFTEHKGKLILFLDLIASQPDEDGFKVMGGTCRSARVVTCEFIIEAMDDLILRRGYDPDLGLPLLDGAISATTEPAPSEADKPAPEAEKEKRSEPKRTASKSRWAEAIMASVRAAAKRKAQPAEEEEDEEPFRPVRPGDILDHQKFGRCVIQRVDQDQEYATVRLRNDRLVRLSLEVLRLRFSGEEEGHQVFRATPYAE